MGQYVLDSLLSEVGIALERTETSSDIPYAWIRSPAANEASESRSLPFGILNHVSRLEAQSVPSVLPVPDSVVLISDDLAVRAAAVSNKSSRQNPRKQW